MGGLGILEFKDVTFGNVFITLFLFIFVLNVDMSYILVIKR